MSSQCAFRRALLILFAAVLLAGISLATPPYEKTTPDLGIRDKSPTLMAFTNATIVVSPTVRYDKATLLIRDGRVLDVGPAITIPADAAVSDLSERTILPGFIEPYSNYGLEKPQRGRPQWGGGQAPQYEAERQGGDSWNDAIHSHIDWSTQFKPDAEDAKTLMKAGFTSAQSCRLDGVFRGRGFVTLLGEGLPNELILVPATAQFVSFDKGSSRQEYPSSQMGSIALIRQTWYDVDWYQKAQAAFKRNPAQSLPEFNRSIAALAESRSGRFIFDPDDDLSLIRADKIARELGLKPIFIGSGYEYGIIDHVKAIGAPIILPVNFPKAPYVNTPNDALDVSLADLRHWEMAPHNPKTLEQHQVEFAFTAYKLKDRARLLDNIRTAIKHGLSKQTALAALTTVPARLCGIDNLAGTLERGKFANFVVLDDDPFDEEADVFSVWIEGKETRLKEYPKHDVRGDYRLALANDNWDFKISGKLTRPKGSLKVGAKDKVADNLSTDGNLLQFTIELDSAATPGFYRFSGRRTNNDFAGECALPSGALVAWQATLISPFDAKADTTRKGDRKEEEPDTTIVSHLTYPNRAYGVTEQPPQENVLIRNATVWTSEADGVLGNTDVLVTNGKFAAVGKGLTAPAGTRVIDATGKHLTAGIIDEHSHIAISKGVNEGSHSVTAECRISDVVNPEDVSIYRHLAGGVTVSHLLHGSANPIGAQAQVIRHRWGQDAEGLKMSAPPTIKFALGENVKQSNWGERFTTRYPQTRMGVETIIRDEFTAAREYEAAWKTYNTLSSADKQKTVPPRRDLRLESVAEVISSRTFIHCHSYVATEILMLMRLAEQFGFRVYNFTHILEGYKLADEMREHGATAGSFADWWAYKFEVYEAMAYSPALMYEKGVITGINSDDAEMARRLNQEAGKSVKVYGDLKPEDALKMVTINPAIQLKIDDRVGSIKVGKDADFVIWDNIPVSTYAKVEQTWIEGRSYFSLDKDRRTREQVANERAALIQKVLKAGGGEKGGEEGGYKKPEKEWHCEDAIDVWRVQP